MRQLLKITTTFVFVLVFTAGMAFGQDPGQFLFNVPNSGEIASIEQVNNNGNQADIKQFDDQITARIRQTGQANIGYIEQDGPSKPSQSDVRAGQYQTGDFNEANLFQQDADGSYAFQSQSGNKNLSEISNTGAQVGVRGQSRTTGSALETYQAGNNNKAYVAQGANQSELVVEQSGDVNVARVEQDNGARSLTADVSQGGDFNDARGFQLGNVQNSSITIDQSGSSNFGRIDQYSSDSSADIVQGSNGNDATILQNDN